MSKSGWFDAEVFYEALDGVRQSKKLNWKQTTDGIEISVPEDLKSVSNHVWVIKVNG